MLLTTKPSNSVYSAPLQLLRVNSWMAFSALGKSIHEFTRISATKQKSRVPFLRFTLLT